MFPETVTEENSFYRLLANRYPVGGCWFNSDVSSTTRLSAPIYDGSKADLTLKWTSNKPLPSP
jgi:hypothetical protein